MEKGKKFPSPFFEVSVMFTPSWGISGSSPALRKRDQTKKRQDASCTFSSEWAMGRKDYYYVVLYFLSLQRVSTSVAHREWSQCLNITKEHCASKQLLLLLFIKGSIGNSGTWIYHGYFGQEAHLTEHPGAKISPCQNVLLPKFCSAEPNMAPKCPCVKKLPVPQGPNAVMPKHLQPH